MLTFAEDFRWKSFAEEPFCIVDSLILSQIAYFDYGKSSFTGRFFGKPLCEFYRERTDILLKGLLTTEGDEQLLEVLKLGGRHGGLRACSYVDEFDREGEKQFAAITFELKRGEYYIAFRGTDCSVTGWKEDFALSFQEEIPAQKEALAYASRIMNRLPGKFYIGGHSKGGNLAAYTAMFLPERLKERVKAVYNFDGPGFLEEVYNNPCCWEKCPTICKIVPQSSVIGMMLENGHDYQVVRSTADAVVQHNPYTWVVEGKDFERMPDIDTFAGIVKRTLEGWLEELPFEERKKIVNTVFDVIYKTGINNFYEITEQRFAKIKSLIEQAANVEAEEKKRIHAAVKRLLAIAADELHWAARQEGAAQWEKAAVQLEKRREQLEKFMR